MTEIITTPIYYVNGEPHIGHAFTSVLADIYAKKRKQEGKDAWLITGTDEHGQKIALAAQSANEGIEKFVARHSDKFRALANLYDVEYDTFVRTSSDSHKLVVTSAWEALRFKGDIYLGKYSGYYSTKEETYYKDSDLIKKPDGYYTPLGEKVNWIEEECFFFKLSAYKERIKALLSENKDFIYPSFYAREALAQIDSLEDIAISRTGVSWGIPVPEHENHVVYVWFDALLNYLTGLGDLCFDTSLSANFVHFIGKDILKFHAIIWPAILFALGLPAPKQIRVNGWFTIAGEKLSKSSENAFDPDENGNRLDPYRLVREYGLDVVRQFFSHVSDGQDTAFRHDLIINAGNRLSHSFGNLAYRTLRQVAKRYKDGFTPVSIDENTEWNSFANELNELKQLNGRAFSDKILTIASHANEYIARIEPWKLDQTRVVVPFSVLLRVILELAKVEKAISPHGCESILADIENEQGRYVINQDSRPPFPQFIVLSGG